jgi:hypothetical protein
MFKDDARIRIFFDNSTLRYWVPIKKSISQKILCKDPSTKHFLIFSCLPSKAFCPSFKPKKLGAAVGS